MTATAHPIAAERTRSVELGWLRLSLAAHRARVHLPPHYHDQATATVVLGGAYGERIAGARHAFAPLALAIRPAGTVHSNDFGSTGARSLILEMADRRAAESLGVHHFFAETRVFETAPATELIFQMVAELGAVNQETILSLEALTAEWIGLLRHASVLSTGDRRCPPWLERVREQIHDAVRPPPPLSDLARDAGYHPVYLARAFRRYFGENIGAYARRIRIIRAARLLATERGNSVSSVALEAGYYDNSHLTREFSAQTRLSPRRWRELAEGSDHTSI